MEKRSVVLKNMKTEKDAEKVSKVLHNVWGVRQVEIQVDKNQASFTFDEKAASFIDFQQALADEGFEVANEKGNIKQ